MNKKIKVLLGLLVLVLVTLACGSSSPTEEPAPTELSQTDSNGEQGSWENYNSPEGNFSTVFPAGSLVDQSYNMDSSITTAAVQTETVYYAAAYSDFAESGAADVIFGNERDKLISGYNDVGGKLVDEKDISLQDYPGIELKFETPVEGALVTSIHRYYLNDTRLYSLSVTTPVDLAADSTVQNDMDTFLNSFAIK